MKNLIYKYLTNFLTKQEYFNIYENIPEWTNTSDESKYSWDYIESIYKELLYLYNIENYSLRVGRSASYFINHIFSKYAKSDTFVITSNFEHFSVADNLLNCSNKLLLTYNELAKPNFESILQKFKESKCNNILVYIAGTVINTGQIVPNYFFNKLKQILIENNVSHTFILDDAHGMFITPRDYSIFDHILYTAHALIAGFDMGILWSKIEEDIGYKNSFYAFLYYTKLCIMLPKFEKAKLFNPLLSQFFSEELATNPNLSLFTNISPHIFSIKTKNIYFTQNMFDKLFKYKIRLNEVRNIDGFIRFRFQDFIWQDPNYVLEGFYLCKKMLSKSNLFTDLNSCELNDCYAFDAHRETPLL